MDMTKDIIDYTQKHTETAERLIASYQSPVSEISESEGNARACATASPFHVGNNKVDAKVAISPTTTPLAHNEMASPATTAQQLEQQQSTTIVTSEADTMEQRSAQEFESVAAADTATDNSAVAPPSKTVGTLVSGDITPPPRPFTTSEVVGLSSALDDDPDLRVDVQMPKSRSLPTSPDHHRHSLDSASAELLTRMNAALFEFEQRRGLDSSMHMPITAAMSAPMRLSKLSKSTAPTSLTARKSVSPIGLKSKKQLAAAAAMATNTQQQQFCLRWNNYQTNLTNVFDELLQNESFVDVTLACEGQSIKAHKMVLSACSPYFQALFYDNPCQHPIIIMRDVRWEELKAIMEFMYKGEINVSQEQINPLLKVAEMLKIRGLAEVSAGGGHGMAAPHPMMPEQRMTIFDDDEEAESDEDTESAEDGGQKPKRARMLDTAILDMNLNAQRQRKRSRDGLFTETNNIARFGGSTSITSNTNLEGRTSNSAVNAADGAIDTDADAMPQPPPVAMTTSTIVRNPFASPNPNNSNSTAASANQNNSQSATITLSTVPTAGTSTPTLASSTPNTPTTPISHAIGHSYRPSGRSSSPSLTSANSLKGAMSSPAAVAANASGISLNVHSHPVAAAAAAAALSVNPHHSHHHHQHAAAAAQQLAAQHQLHAAAQSHAAMASALGASLAAGAAGAGGASAAGTGAGGASNLSSTVGHHEEMEIKPEIAEMIREEERVSEQLFNVFYICGLYIIN
ncbi:protein bric-a-brac 2-like [Anastrepha ludens]|uniref:protein bric-a-brac 2-like n=1 Tax=Anastrepha ludens TaxID=28586 RepID=UPI0023AFCC38|nr:protein bric-a-brac 2-like [Anastrepha ludens]XP_053956838.1 protein bric-a-brac 2-like [Anastrepha ludens]